MSILDHFKLTGKRLFITGGSRGLGRSMALACADAGADCILVGRDEASLERSAGEVRALGRQAFTHVADISDPIECEAACERALADTKDEPRPLFDAYFCLSSGGSSGRRGVFVKDLEAWTEFSLALNRGEMKRIARAGGPPPGGGEIAMIASGSAVHSTGAARAWTAGGLIRFCAVPVTLPLSEMVERLEALQPAALYGYPSVLARLAREQREGRLRISPQWIRTTSENLLTEWRTAISQAFGAPIIDTYGTTEGLAGVSEPDGTCFTFNSETCILELVDAAGSPVPPGVASARILLTNLSNRIQPLIRYEIGDRFVRLPDSPDHGHLRASVEGRADDVLRFGKIEIHPFVIRSVLVKTPEVSDYQVRQTVRGIELYAQADTALETGPLRRELIASLGVDHVVEFSVDGGDPVDEDGLRQIPGVRQVRAANGTVTLQATELHTVVPALLATLADSGHPLTELRTHSATLEDVFVSLTGRHLRDE